MLVLTADLLFGSRVQGTLAADGHEVELVADAQRLRSRMDDDGAPEVLVVDLTDSELDGATVVESLIVEGVLPETHTLGFYSHVEAQARERAERAGFELVVPRSRMAREGAALVGSLSHAAGPQ